MPKLPHINPGDPDSALSAESWNFQSETIERAGNLTVIGAGTGLTAGPAGRTVARPRETAFWAKLSAGPSGNKNPYGFAELAAQPGGIYAPLVGGITGKGRHASDPTDLSAYEVNNIEGLAGKNLWLTPGYPGDFRGQWVAKGSTPSNGGIDPSGCLCTNIPATLSLTTSLTLPTHVDGSNAICFQYQQSGFYTSFQSQTLTYAPPGSTPPGDGPHGGGTASAGGWVSSIFTAQTEGSDDQGNSVFYDVPTYYVLRCGNSLFDLTICQKNGNGWSAETVWQWAIGVTGNTCDPFALCTGSPIGGNSGGIYASCGGDIKVNCGGGYSGYTGYTAMMASRPAAARYAATTRPPSPTGRLRVGLFAPCLYRGGGETHQLALVRATRESFDWQGVAVIADDRSFEVSTLAETQAELPVAFGWDAARALAEQCDVILSWVAEDVSPVLHRITPRPVVAFIDHFPHDAIYDSAMRAVLRSVDQIVGVSELCMPGFPPEFTAAYRTSVIWHGLDPTRQERTATHAAMHEEWGVPPGVKVAGYMSRLDPRRGPDAMIRLVECLPADWHVVMVGDPGPYLEFKAQLDDQIAALSADSRDRLHCLPPVSRPADALGAFDVLCTPVRSDGESWGFTIAEGIACGVPVVSTPTGLGILMPGLTTVVPFNPDGQTLATAVLRAHREGTPDGLRAEFLARASMDRFGRDWTDLIRRVAAAPARPDPARVWFEVENCVHSNGTCGCNGVPRPCDHPDRPDAVLRDYCFRCKSGEFGSSSEPISINLDGVQK